MVVTFHLGKSKIDEDFIETIKTSFKRQDVIKIKVLKSQTRNKEEIKNLAQSIAKNIETEDRRYRWRVIGFTIILNKFRKHKKQP
jgi:RNA-binding protein YhbY